METWFLIIVSLCISALLKSLFNLLSPTTTKHKLPPGPPTIPIIGNLLWFRKSFAEHEPILRNLKLKYGPIITLKTGSLPTIFVGSHSLSYKALIQNGAVFSDRPHTPPTSKLTDSNHNSVNTAAYGPTWRVFRRNLASEILHPSRVKSYSRTRKWVLGNLIHRLLKSGQSESTVQVLDHLQYAMFCLLVHMCFGDNLNDNQIKQIESVQRKLLMSLSSFSVLNFWPRVGKILFRNRWKELLQISQDQEDVFLPLIKGRVNVKQRQVVAYVDTLMNLQLPEEKRKLNTKEIVSLCSEFLNAGTDTTTTALHWIMANLVKYPHIQTSLYEEITSVVGLPKPPSFPQVKGNGDEEMSIGVEEEDLRRMPYLKAVVLEGLRRHPPAHFVLPHSVIEEVELGGYVIPKGATVNFMVAEMGWDSEVWDEPLEFKPERFFATTRAESKDGGEAFDITGSRDIKMMPFGAGRRICPALNLAMLHLEYFVANLIWYFEWTTAGGEDVDLSEKQEFTMIMKNPLQAHLSPRVE